MPKLCAYFQHMLEFLPQKLLCNAFSRHIFLHLLQKSKRNTMFSSECCVYEPEVIRSQLKHEFQKLLLLYTTYFAHLHLKINSIIWLYQEKSHIGIPSKNNGKKIKAMQKSNDLKNMFYVFLFFIPGNREWEDGPTPPCALRNIGFLCSKWKPLKTAHMLVLYQLKRHHGVKGARGCCCFCCRPHFREYVCAALSVFFGATFQMLFFCY